MKEDGSFFLDSATWPAFWVESGGTLRSGNRAAVKAFGAALEAEGTTLAAIWAAETESAEQFLARWERAPAPMVPLRFRGKGGAVSEFATYITLQREGQHRFLFQLVQELAASPAPSAAPAAASPAQAASAGNNNTRFFVNESPQAIRQKLECAVQLTRSVALDFNNALTSILGHTSLMLSQADADNPWRPSLIAVEKGVYRAAEIAQHLATFSRSERDQPAQPTGSLNAIVTRVAETFQRSGPKGIEWSLQLEPHLYAAKFDDAKMQQAITKVLENAIEAIGLNGHLTLTSSNLDLTSPSQDRTAQLQPGSYVILQVSDDGPGISPDDLPRVFEPFFTTKRGHRGLGLAWVYGIVTNLGGGVAISSEVGRGTSVRIYLPASQQVVRDGTGSLLRARGMYAVLMVDDEDLLLNMGQIVLTGGGYKVVTAGSGKQALHIIDHANPPIDIVVADLVMPNMSGRELIEAIRRKHPDTAIVCSSGYAFSGQVRPGEGFLQKPYTSQDLLRCVQQALENRVGL